MSRSSTISVALCTMLRREGDPAVGEFKDAEVIGQFGEMPRELRA